VKYIVTSFAVLWQHVFQAVVCVPSAVQSVTPYTLVTRSNVDDLHDPATSQAEFIQHNLHCWTWRNIVWCDVPLSSVKCTLNALRLYQMSVFTKYSKCFENYTVRILFSFHWIYVINWKLMAWYLRILCFFFCFWPDQNEIWSYLFPIKLIRLFSVPLLLHISFITFRAVHISYCHQSAFSCGFSIVSPFGHVFVIQLEFPVCQQFRDLEDQ
jgi:hypothetical protein